MNGFGRFFKLPAPVASTNAADPFLECSWIKVSVFVTSKTVT